MRAKSSTGQPIRTKSSLVQPIIEPRAHQVKELRPTAKPFDGIKEITFGQRVHQGQKRLAGTWQTQERHLIWRIEERAAIFLMMPFATFSNSTLLKNVCGIIPGQGEFG